MLTDGSKLKSKTADGLFSTFRSLRVLKRLKKARAQMYSGFVDDFAMASAVGIGSALAAPALAAGISWSSNFVVTSVSTWASNITRVGLSQYLKGNLLSASADFSVQLINEKDFSKINYTSVGANLLFRNGFTAALWGSAADSKGNVFSREKSIGQTTFEFGLGGFGNTLGNKMGGILKSAPSLFSPMLRFSSEFITNFNSGVITNSVFPKEDE